MKDEIQEALSVLIGKPLWGSSRAADMEMFQLGDRKAYRGGWRGDYALHVQCPWEIREGSRSIVESRDVYLPRADGTADATEFHWDQLGANLRDQRLELLFQEHDSKPLAVERIQAAETGVATITFSKGISLEMFVPTAASREWWRLFQPAPNTEHFIVTAEGIETVGPQ
jgi:hypothetical protein